jgi:hypothetical protein
MTYYDRVRIRKRENSLAEISNKVDEILSSFSASEPLAETQYVDDDPVADGLTSMVLKTAAEKKMEDQIADQKLRMLI